MISDVMTIIIVYILKEREVEVRKSYPRYLGSWFLQQQVDVEAWSRCNENDKYL